MIKIEVFKAVCFVYVSLILILGCSNSTAQKKSELIQILDLELLLDHITDAEHNGEACNSDFGKVYSNDSKGVNDFIKHLLCQTRCYGISELHSDYFGTDKLTLDKLRENQGEITFFPLKEFDYIPKNKRILYIKAAITAQDTLTNLVKSEEILTLANVDCIPVQVLNFLIYIHKSKKHKLADYDEILEKLYQNFKLNDAGERADIVLDLLRYVNTAESSTFLSNKKFSSDFFKRDGIIEFKKKEKDSYPFENLL